MAIDVKDLPRDAEAVALGIRVLHEFKQAFEAEGVMFWLDGGACLKAYRDGQFVCSTDIDIAVWRDQIDAVVRAAETLRARGYRVRYQGGMPYVDDLLQIVPPMAGCPFVLIDVVMYRRLNGEAVKINTGRPAPSQPFAETLVYLLKRLRNGSFSDRSLLTRCANRVPQSLRNGIWWLLYLCYHRFCRTAWFVVPEALFDGFVDVELHGTTWRLPRRAEDFLRLRYGANWKTPDKSWRLVDGELLRFRHISCVPVRDICRRWIGSDRIDTRVTGVPARFSVNAEERRAIVQRS